MITISHALFESVETLDKVSDTPNLDAQILLANALGKSRAWIISHPEEFLSKSDVSTWRVDLSSLQKGVPLPYVIGHWEFYGMDFAVTPDTLIPRPETELIVDQALDWLGEHQGYHLAVDIGTGTGCIAVALAKHESNLTVIATDISLSALKSASSNSCHHDVDERVHFLQCDLLFPLDMHFDLICANLPYIPTEILPSLKVFGREPDLALNGGKEGLDLIAQLLEIAPSYINLGGVLLIEIESTQGVQVQSIAKQHFPFANIRVIPDLSNHDRVVRIQQPNNIP